MGKIEMFRKALALPEVVQNVELTEMLKDLYTDHLELLETNNEIKDRLSKLENISDIKKKAKKYNGFYTLENEKYADGSDICFCLNCLYEHNLQIPMTYGIIERGRKEYFSGETVIPTTYGNTCNKCGTHLAMSNRKK